MPRFDYTNLQNTAAQLIQRFGQTATLRKTISDPNSPGYAPGVTQSTAQIEVVSETEQIRDESGALIGRQQRTLLAAPTTLIPAAGDEIVINGQVERIESVKPLQPGSSVIMNKIVLKG